MATSFHQVDYYDPETGDDFCCEVEVGDGSGYPEVIAIRSVIPGSQCFLHTADPDQIKAIEAEIYRNAVLGSSRYSRGLVGRGNVHLR